MKTKYISLLCMLLTVLLVAACGGDSGLEGEKREVNDQDNDGTTAVIDDNYTYQLPVIFHVLYQDKTDATQYVQASRLKQILDYVNLIYQGGVYGESANTHLRFVLAETDENGQKLSTPGVEYVYYPEEYPIDPSDFMTGRDNRKYIWDPNEYINVMMYHFKDTDGGELLGISHMPYTVKGEHQLEGLEVTTESFISKQRLGYPLCSSINSFYAGQSPTGSYYQSSRYTASGREISTIYYNNDVVVTLAHELGHYLGLQHVFTERNKSTWQADIFEPVDSCADTDYCQDTPSYNRAEYLSYLSNLSHGGVSSLDMSKFFLRSPCDGTAAYMSTNIMDYYFSMGYKISPDQRSRIRHVLYYSPLMPGPRRKSGSSNSKRTRAADEESGKIYTRPRLIR